MANDDDVRSVRIELDDGVVVDGLEIPEIESQPTGVSKFAVIIGLVVIVALGLVLLGLSPDEDEAADGTLRETPATTTPDSLSSDDSSSEPLVVPELVLPDAQAGLATATLIEDPNFVSSIVSTNEGFLGLAGPAVTNPTLVASSDGVSWVEVETIIENPAGIDLTSLLVVELRSIPEQAGGGFVMLAFDFSISQRSGEQFRTEILTSSDGLVWEVIDTSGPQAEGRVPRLFLGDSIITTIDQGRPIDALISEHTDLVIAGEPVCRITRQVDTEDPRLWLSLCEGGGSVLLGESNIVSGASANGVLTCALALSSEQTGTRTGLRLLDLEEGANSPFGVEDSAFFLGPDPFPELFSLGIGGVALHDVGSSVGDACDGIIDPGPDREPSIVLLDARSGSEASFAIPIEATDVRIVGETSRFVGQAPYLLVEIDSNLWSLHQGSGEWAQLTVDGSETTSDGFLLSESGNRVYQLLGSSLRVIDLEVGFGGRFLSATQDDVPIESIPFNLNLLATGFPFLTNDVVFASDDLVMVSNDSGELWLIDAPAVVRDSPRPLAEDQGGVGLAR